MIQIFSLYNQLMQHYIYLVICSSVLYDYMHSYIITYPLSKFCVLHVRSYEESDILLYLLVYNLAYHNFIDADIRHETTGSETQALITAGPVGSQHELHVCISFSCLLSPMGAVWRLTQVDVRFTVDLCQFLDLGSPSLLRANQAKCCPRGRHYIYYTGQHTNVSRTPEEDTVSVCTVQTSVKSQCLYSQGIQKPRTMKNCFPILHRTQQSRYIAGTHQMLK